MTTEFKLVPVETLKFALGITRHGFKNRTDQEADKYAALKTITEILESPTPPQPIYDEAKERELFAIFMASKHPQTALRCWGENQGCNGCGDYEDDEASKIWQGWLACAQSRAKSVGVKSD